ncbi:helix-turn-helix domain-containing protein [Enterobacter wuhouensis]|uniref:helix-turn-helix domain-containing protein n=1 Tax=Enterobacter wuhouensis TaxID=2529381 RepID=UPI00352442B0
MSTAKITLEEAVSTLGEYIEKSKESCMSVRKKNQRLDTKNEKKIYYLKSGTVSLYPLENNIVSVDVEAPAVLGMDQMFHGKLSHSIRCGIECELMMIDESEFIGILNHKGLWPHAFCVLSFHYEMCFQLKNRPGKKNINSIVTEHLRYLWGMDEDKRGEISVYTFILARSQISRSSIYNVLSKLTDNGIIELERGKLVWMKNAE